MMVTPGLVPILVGIRYLGRELYTSMVDISLAIVSSLSSMQS